MTRESAYKRGYNHRWRKARQTFLRRNPLCVSCLRLEIVRESSEVDHIVPHRGCQEKFWDSKNWQALCKQCHSRKTFSGEKILGCDINGIPADPNHPWNLEVANG